MNEQGAYWEQISGNTLRQGDHLVDCQIPIFESMKPDSLSEIPLGRGDLIVLTQSCDLERGRDSNHVALCSIYQIPQFLDVNPQFRSGGRLNQVKKGRIEGLHLLGSQSRQNDLMGALIVDFRQIYSLPFRYLTEHAEYSGNRWRLVSPFLEHFSQAFARFYMRVGLPAQIPDFPNSLEQ